MLDIFRIIARYEEYIEIKILKKFVKPLLKKFKKVHPKKTIIVKYVNNKSLIRKTVDNNK